MTRNLYAGDQKLDTIDDLKEALLYEWHKLDITYLRNLISSMPDRVRECGNNEGGETSY